EAYFEVARNTEKPFRVSVNNQAEVEVLGTSFNLNAYVDETGINTTLLEGSIRVVHIPPGQRTQPGMESAGQGTSSQVVSPDQPAIILKPGQQAQLIPIGRNDMPATQKAQPGIKVINNPDIDNVMAWKN